VTRKVNFSKLIKEYSAKVYKEIATFENYSKYIPNCSSAKLIEKNDSFEIGELQFNFFLKNYSIKSKNILMENSIKISQIDGPFESFEGEWTIKQKDKYLTEINFSSEFELPFLLDNLIPDQLINTFSDAAMEAFIDRLTKKK
tara:strand:- start:204 stop:632 length:429 start_codon:yes stop_codon:yes gene_type:complete